jgi:hypothetical protein
MRDVLVMAHFAAGTSAAAEPVLINRTLLQAYECKPSIAWTAGAQLAALKGPASASVPSFKKKQV